MKRSISWIPAFAGMTETSGLCLLALTLLTAATASAAPFAWHSVESVPRFGVIEISIKTEHRFGNPFVDANLMVVFSTSGRDKPVDGFFYGDDLWKIRFSPDEPGHWTYQYVLSGTDGFYLQGDGAFDCSSSDALGPVRQHPENPYRWIVTTERPGQSYRPYFPIGLQDCARVVDGALTPRLIDGDERPGSGRSLTADEYFAVYADAGFNLFRFSQQNCSFRLFDDLDHYRDAEARVTDELLSTARAHGFRVMFGFFGFYDRRQGKSPAAMMRSLLGEPEDKPISAEDRPLFFKQQRFIDYCVARWGVYVDVWELLNERYATDEWTALMAAHVRAVDADHKPVATSYEKPFVPTIGVNAPHWYESENELDSDLRVQRLATEWKIAGKPVIVGEQGNLGRNWDPRSATRMRIRAWTALFSEIALVFWNTSGSRSVTRNIYLGPEERGYVRVLQDFTARLDADVRPMHVDLSSPNSVRAYALRSSQVMAAYLHHVSDHTTESRDLTIAVDWPTVGDESSSALIAEWIEPASGQRISCAPLPSPHAHLSVPPFAIDLALLITRTPIPACPPA